MEFINLTEQEDKPILKFTPGEVSIQETETFTILQLNLPEQDSDSILVPECQHSSNIACPDSAGHFAIENLFSELKTEYDKMVARSNLGISSKDTLLWGNILGSLVNQEDLVSFITEQISASSNEVKEVLNKRIDELNAQSTETVLYYGPSPTSLVKSTKTTFTTGNYSGYIYVLTPKANTTFICNGLIGGFYYVSELEYAGQVQYLFKSAYENLGVTTITVSYG